MRKLNRVGEVRISKQGEEMTIIKYINSKDIIVQFINENGIANVKTQYDSFKKGGVKNPYLKSIFGFGFIGIGKHKVSIEKQPTNKYKAWKNMLYRCYDKKFHEKRPAYIGCTTCEEWHNFQNFAGWYECN